MKKATALLNFKKTIFQPFILLALMVVSFLLCTSAFAVETTTEAINLSQMAMGLFGGLALFLLGMEQMSDSLKSALGNQMKVLLAKLTRNRFTGALTGDFVTAQLSSLHPLLLCLENVKRIHTYFKRIAREYVPKEMRD